MVGGVTLRESRPDIAWAGGHVLSLGFLLSMLAAAGLWIEEGSAWGSILGIDSPTRVRHCGSGQVGRMKSRIYSNVAVMVMYVLGQPKIPVLFTSGLRSHMIVFTNS